MPRWAARSERRSTIVPECWTLLILRDVYFDAFLQRLPIARNVLADRLNTLVAHGIMERVPYQERPVRHTYRLTRKGVDLSTALTALMQWGDRYLASEAGPPSLVLHRACGHEVEATVVCPSCDRRVPPAERRLVDGPGAATATLQTAHQAHSAS